MTGTGSILDRGADRSGCRSSERGCRGLGRLTLCRTYPRLRPRASGPKVKHDFILANRLAEPITILSLRPSCGCTSGKASTSMVNPGASAVIEAQMDTRNFLGLKSTILFVTLMTSSGKEAEVRLGVTSTILADIVLNPGSIDFGSVMKGQTPSQTLTIDRIAPPGWKFERMVSSSRALTAELAETRRDKAGAVCYTLRVGIKPDAPAGPVRDEIRILSNDRETPSIPIIVTAMIRGDLSSPLGAGFGRGKLGGRQAGAVHHPRHAALCHHRSRRSRRRLRGPATREDARPCTS